MQFFSSHLAIKHNSSLHTMVLFCLGSDLIFISDFSQIPLYALWQRVYASIFIRIGMNEWIIMGILVRVSLVPREKNSVFKHHARVICRSSATFEMLCSLVDTEDSIYRNVVCPSVRRTEY